MDVRRRGRGREQGATLVEFAIILPVIVLLIMGIIDFGGMYNDWQQLRQGVREGARYSVVANLPSDTTCNPSGVTSVEAQEIICMTKNRAGLGSGMRVGIWTPLGNGWKLGDPLVVCGQYPAKSTSGLTAPFLSGRVLKSKVEMRIEQPLPQGNTFAPQQEPALGSGGWPSECSTL